MATVYVGSARNDENGKATGGQPGDQKGGREVSTQKWYEHDLGWRVFRAIDPGKAEKIGQEMRDACDNDNIGYDQSDRYDLFRDAEKAGFELENVNTPTEVDCSELVRCCCAAAGIMNLPTSGFRTGNMPKNLLATGEFIELTGDKYTKSPDYLGKGDILVTRSAGHTVVVLNDGDEYEGTVDPDELGKGDEGSAVVNLQKQLLALGYNLGEFGSEGNGVDGDFGSKTEEALKAFQRAQGLNATGTYNTATREAMAKAISQPTQPGDGAAGKAMHMVEITGVNVNVRLGDSIEYRSVGKLGKGAKYPYVATSIPNGWHAMRFGEQIAWVSDEYSKIVEG